MSLQTQLDKLLPAPPTEDEQRQDHLRILLLDIETYPALTWAFDLRDQYTPHQRILQDDGMLSIASKWYAEPETEFRALWTPGEAQGMAEHTHARMCEADAVVTYNGRRFDEPWLRRVVELESGLGPVSPFTSVDLFPVAKRFKYLSRSLAYMCDRLDLGHKVNHQGFAMWPKCMPTWLIGGEGDPEAQAEMEAYNRGDVADTLEPLYDALLPWVKGHPHVGLYAEDGSNRCQRCATTALRREGLARTPLGVYRRYQCERCRSWHRGKTRVAGVDVRGM